MRMRTRRRDRGKEGERARVLGKDRETKKRKLLSEVVFNYEELVCLLVHTSLTLVVSHTPTLCVLSLVLFW